MSETNHESGEKLRLSIHIVGPTLAARGIDIEGVSHVINDAISGPFSLYTVSVVQDVTVYRVLPYPLSTE